MAERLSKYFPIEDIIEDCYVNGLFDVTAGFALHWPEVYTLSDEDYLNIHNGLVSLISRLPAGAMFHYQGYFFDTVFKGAYNGSSVIQRENFKYYYDRPILKQYSNVFVTFQAESNVPRYSGSPLSRAWDWLSGKRTGGIEKAVSNYRKYFGPFEQDLNLIHNRIKARRLTSENLLCAAYDYFNLSYDNPVLSADSALKGIQDIEIDYDAGYMRVGDQYVAVVTLTKEGGYLTTSQDKANAKLPANASKAKLPKAINLHTSMPFLIGIGLPFNHIVNVGIEVLDNEEASASMSGLNGLGTSILAGAGVREATSKQQEKELFLNTLAGNNYRACRTKVNVIVNDSSLSRLQEKLNYVKNAFVRMNDSTVFFENEHAANLFLSSSPGAMKFLYREPILQTVDQAVCYIPKETQYFSDEEGIVFVDRFGAPVVVNIWNSPHIVNKNGVIFGPSRTGKSVALNHITTQFLHYVSSSLLATAHHVIIIDIGGSYKKNASINGGFYFDASDRKNLSFNIFLCQRDSEGNWLYNKVDEDGEGGEDKINYVFLVLRKLWRGNEKVTPDEKNVLKDSIKEFYEYINEHKIFPTLIEYRKFLDVYTEKIMKPEYRSFINFESFKLAVEPYVSGEYKYLLNSESNIDLKDQSFIVFDLQGIMGNEDLSNIVMTIIIGITADKVENTHGVRKTVIIDEAIDFMRGDSGDFIGGYYRKIAKRGGNVFIATQGVGYLDDVDPLVRKSIFGNSDIKILLNHKQARSSYPALKKNLGLTDHELDLIDSMENGDRYREIFIKLGDVAKVYRTEISYFAEGVYTTTKEELDEIYALEKEYQNLGYAINQFVYNKYVKRREEVENKKSMPGIN